MSTLPPFTKAMSVWLRRGRRVPRWAWLAAAVTLGLVFRKAIMWLVVGALVSVLGLGWHMPRFEWPWSSTPVVRTVTTNTSLGPWILQKIEGISKPALGRANFTWTFTHKVSKSIGPWPCWYSATFFAYGHASATVNLNPGPTWWEPSTGNYRLQVRGKSVSIAMVLPLPQLPQTVHDVAIDNISSQPIATDHSWTYPGFGCGVLLRPQFSASVLYALAQQMAFDKSIREPDITGPLISAAENQAVLIIRDNFVQPTLNALGYKLGKFTITWVKGE